MYMDKRKDGEIFVDYKICMKKQARPRRRHRETGRGHSGEAGISHRRHNGG